MPLAFLARRAELAIDGQMAMLLAGILVLNLGVHLPIAPLRAVVVLPYALILPGAAWCQAAFDGAPPARIPRIALWILLSLALYPLDALLLEQTAYPLNATNIAMVTSAVALVGLAGHQLRHGLRLLARADLAPYFGGSSAASSHASWPPWLNPRRVARCAMAATPFFVLLSAATTKLPGGPSSPFSQLALDGYWAHLDHKVQLRQPSLTVTVRVTNHTGRQQLYRLEPTIDDRQRWTILSRRVANGGSWAAALDGAVPQDGCLHRLRIALRQSGVLLSGSLTLWLQAPIGRRAGCDSSPQSLVQAATAASAIPPAPRAPREAGASHSRPGSELINQSGRRTTFAVRMALADSPPPPVR